MHFYLLKSKSSLEIIDDYPAITIRRDSWDDYSYQTTSELTYYESKSALGVLLGHTKITNNSGKYGYTVFELDKFDRLSDSYCSLGQNIDFYKNIRRLGLRHVLDLLKDCAISDSVREKFIDVESYKDSLLRSPNAEKMLDDAKLLFSPSISPVKEEMDFSFSYKTYISASEEPLKLSFDFKAHDILPYRINVIVGKNGTGKSLILSSLALDLSRMSRGKSSGEISKAKSTIFGNTNVISYSPFDSFKDVSELNDGKVTKNNVKSGFLPYNFFGIRKIEELNGKKKIILKSHDEIKSELKAGFNKIMNRNILDFYDESLKLTLGRKVKYHKPSEIISNYESFSSGQKILIKMVTDFLSEVEKDDIILIDEPETYLHPQGVSNFYHCIFKMLDFTKSYCILATHSPIIIQETPSRYIQILKRKMDSIKITKPSTETLGQGISTITNDIFQVESDDFSFFDTLKSFSKKGLSLDELEEELGNKLDFKAKSIYLSMVR